jgi:hypothetical protein
MGRERISMSSEDKRYRECMAEITAALQKYDMAGAITVVTKKRAMYKYHFPTWSTLTLHENTLRFRSKREDFPSAEAQHEATELSVHIIMQMRDIATQTVALMEDLHSTLCCHMKIEHTPGADFDPERNN